MFIYLFICIRLSSIGVRYFSNFFPRCARCFKKARASPCASRLGPNRSLRLGAPLALNNYGSCLFVRIVPKFMPCLYPFPAYAPLDWAFCGYCYGCRGIPGLYWLVKIEYFYIIIFFSIIIPSLPLWLIIGGNDVFGVWWVEFWVNWQMIKFLWDDCNIV